jgi:hypothetical protein
MPRRRRQLDSLLKYAVEAHGGLRAWDKLQSLRANVSIGGAVWDLKQFPWSDCYRRIFSGPDAISPGRNTVTANRQCVEVSAQTDTSHRDLHRFTCIMTGCGQECHLHDDSDNEKEDLTYEEGNIQ